VKIKLIAALLVLICFGVEYGMAWNFLQEIVPFPWSEFWYKTLNAFLRDVLLIGVGLLLYSRRGRIRDRAKRYFPVVVIGIMYLLDAWFMVTYIEMDWGFMTTLSVLAGLFNNIVIVLVTAMCYHHWPNKGMKVLYFLIYFATGFIMLGDAVYFWNTSMHIESVLFENLNYYAAKGILSTTEPWKIGLFAVLLVVLAALFRVTRPHKKKPNLPWSLLCVVMFGLGLNLTYLLCREAVYQALITAPDIDIEGELEKTRKVTRDGIVYPINVNFVQKALFKTDKVVHDPSEYKKRELTEKDVRVLTRLGILPKQEAVLRKKPAYDRVVMLILESVHRDYIHYYNPVIPAETTPYLDSLVAKYPHMDHYYSSAVPTTQGLNATFRSQLIYDGDLPGEHQPSLFRSLSLFDYPGTFLSASSRYYNNEYREYPKQFGMDTYLAKEDLGKMGYTGASGWGFHNDVMYDATLKFLEANRGSKFFLVTKTLDMHQPYPYYGIGYEDMPEKVRDQGTATVCGMYWVDQTLKHFFEEAEKEGFMDERTLFIITSDHNPHSGGEYKKLVEKAQDKQSVAPIPLIFVSKNLEPLKTLESTDYASQEDLAPTLLALLSLPVPEEFMGRNLLQPAEHPYALGYFGGKAYYYSADLNVISTLDEAVPDMEEKDAIANYIMYNYIERHLKYTPPR
jgi:phosphoglycerol transferase MdoB-like AlkP superfamily enzyme